MNLGSLLNLNLNLLLNLPSASPGSRSVSRSFSNRGLSMNQLTFLVKDGAVTVDAAKVVKTDIAASNGVIHVIDSVILPKE
jgi:uncharacterized surface protein with fasciclin (FAS1) repeats